MINTNVQNDFTLSARLYYQDLRNCKPLTKEEERDLIKQAQTGNIQARNKIVKSNLKFVFDVAKKYKGKGISLSDLISEGNNGLFIAIDKFDLTKDTKFITYAVFWIRERIMSALEDYNKKTLLESSLDELVSIDNSMQCKKIGIMYSDNDECVNSRESLFLQNEVKYDTKLNKIETFINVLNSKEKHVILSFYGIGCQQMSLKKLSQEMKISAERVRQIKLSGIRKMRSYALLDDDIEIF